MFRKLWAASFAGCLWGLVGHCQAADLVRAPVVRDTWFSGVGDEARCNLGGAAKLKFKSIQELSLIDIEPKPLRGRIVTQATLHLHLDGSEILHRVTVGTFGSEWVEGTSTSYSEQEGSSTFAACRHPNISWAGPGSDLTAVMLGQGGTTWRMANASKPDAGRWQSIPVDPIILAARIAGISQGFVVFDDTGTEWTRDGEKYTERLFPNRFVNSRESGPRTAPYLTIELGENDAEAPLAPTDLQADVSDLPAGEARVSWKTPADRGPAGVVGFFVETNGKETPRYLVPAAGRSGEVVTMRLRDLAFQPGERVQFQVTAVDGAGNRGPQASLTFTVSDEKPQKLGGEALPQLRAGGTLPRLGKAEVAIIDGLDKMHPISGVTIPPQAAEYLTCNHLWSAADKQIRLHAAKNEFASFQIVLRGVAADVKPSLTFSGKGKLPEVTFFGFRYVATASGPLPDPLVPLRGGFSVPSSENQIHGQKNGSLLCEIYVPHDTAAGAHSGVLTLNSKAGELKLAVALDVWNFTLPDHLSFLPEMNCYDLPANERDYYRLAHRHRTVLNRVPYHQNGQIEPGCAPIWDGQHFDWRAWDLRFGPYFDGSAFADLPRRGVPLECVYLALHENWPSPIEPNYNGSYWADVAFRPGYREAFVEASRQIATHFGERGWRETLFHCFQNGKSNFKQQGWSRGSSPWLLDEPANFQDYWALRYFGEAFHEGVQKGASDAKLVFRCDISRPEWQRDALDHLLDYNVVGGGAFLKYRRLVLDRKQRLGEIVVCYGGTNDITQSNVQPLAWSVDTWLDGADGVLPWQTIGTDASWQNADALSLFYPGGPAGQTEPVASVRLHAFTRGQQDTEYLTLLARTERQSRRALARRVRDMLRLTGSREGTGFAGVEDAGRIDYGRILPQDLWALRVRIGELLSKARPKPERKLVDFRTPQRDSHAGVPGYVAGTEPVATVAPTFTAKPTISQIIQGRPAVHDVVIDPEKPETNLGNVARDNRLYRNDKTSVLLVRFDLAGLKTPPSSKVERATLHFWIWDPASQGRTRVSLFGLKVAWDEGSATWLAPDRRKHWQEISKGFTLGRDTDMAASSVVVEPDQGSDTAEPPVEYHLDATDLVRTWLAHPARNLGAAIAPVIDRSVDDGQVTRFQVLTSEYRELKFTPKLTIEFTQ